jgi:hypothetical protein
MVAVVSEAQVACLEECLEDFKSGIKQKQRK